MEKIEKIIVPNSKRYDVFLIRGCNPTFLGIRKKTSNNSKYSILEKSMVKGILIDIIENKDSSTFVIKIPQTTNWRDLATSQSNIDIFFPYPPTNKDGTEFVCPDEYWNTNALTPEKLDSEEEHFRQYTCNVLKHIVFDGCIIYDPACSTGEFLFYLKKHFPLCEYIASDRSPAMVSIAKSKISNTFVTDITHNNNNLCCDIIICRFLNHEVITSQAAQTALKNIITMLNSNGKIIIFGHTPVILDMLEFSTKNKLNLLTTVGYSKDPEGIFQYYVIEKQK